MIFFSNSCSPALKQSSSFHVRMLPIKCLGVPLHSRRPRSCEFQPIIDKVKKKIDFFAACTLSMPSRLAMPKAVVYPQIYCCLQVFKLPTATFSLETSICNFLWKRKSKGNDTHKGHWVKTCLPKEEGGLGLKNFQAWNTVALGKLIWV